MLPKNDTIFWTEEGPKGSICCSHAGLTYLRGRSAHCAKGRGVNNTFAVCLGEEARSWEAGQAF